ncbi:hypothetical protein EI94DRAFT_1811768 [Lactarius quietus]|nr:hypothetical protein EI94DRAFT_1811768 [Lactarius quietus]
MAEIQTHLDEMFTLTLEQKMNIHFVAGELLLDPNRVRYTQLSIDVEIRICEKQKELRFFNIFGNLARQRLLGSTIRCTCSSVQNAYREMLCDSVTSFHTSTLDDFVINLSNRFIATQMPLTRPFVTHVALLRQFAMEHPQVLDRMAEEDTNNNKPAENRSRSNSTQPDGPDTEEYSRPSSAMSTTSQHSKKHRRGGQLVPPTLMKGTDFWSMVDNWFAFQMQSDQRGTSWNTPGWTTYIESTVDQDRKKFKPAPCVNPFIGDPTAVAAECEGGVSGVDARAMLRCSLT